ncbi:MAG: hypothetical protein JJ978_11770 [Roseivirga sp.]|uniref:condensin complex protein MksE n=1 Tax=Roseivirga sp. TaxID=1964215 RepID=UPI001B2DAB6D|nr:hypothetical protein [Roseivirga sp.]MBO6496238.1 hypothetical protein [Roseivirga sp.]
MENENLSESVISDFSFLSEAFVQEHFADLNNYLLGGGHVEKNDRYFYQVLSEYWDELCGYYDSLYQIKLSKGTNGDYYYLGFFESGTGKLSNPKRHKELTDKQLVTGLVLLKLYSDKEFEKDKTITWADLKREFFEGEDSKLYKKAFFKEVREHYSDPEIETFRAWFDKVLSSFEKIGWVEKIIKTQEVGIQFTIRESIQRLALIYEKEIVNFDEFIDSYHNYSNSK